MQKMLSYLAALALHATYKLRTGGVQVSRPCRSILRCFIRL